MRIQPLFAGHVRSNRFLRALMSFFVVGAASCIGATAPQTNLVLSTSADFSATVAKVESENTVGPNGPYSQRNVWVVLPPATAANASVVVPNSMPVFIRGKGGRLTPALSGDIRVGDSIEVWRDSMTAYGSVQGPQGAPTYRGTQIVITR